MSYGDKKKTLIQKNIFVDWRMNVVDEKFQKKSFLQTSALKVVKL